MDSLAAAEQQARPGDVVLDAGRRLARRPGRGVPRSAGGERGTWWWSSLGDRSPPAAGTAADGRLPEELVRQWLLPAVYERLVPGRGEFLAELRPAVPLFVRFGGIDYDRPGAPTMLDDFVRRAQRPSTARRLASCS